MRLIDADTFNAYHYIIPNDVDEDSFSFGVMNVLDAIDNTPTFIPENCKKCFNHPSNGGSGMCHCILGTQIKIGEIYDKYIPYNTTCI